MYKPRILYLFFYRGGDIYLSPLKYSVTKAYAWSDKFINNKLFSNKIFDLIILGGGKSWASSCNRYK